MQPWTAGAEGDDPFVLGLLVGTSRSEPVDVADLCRAVVRAVASARQARPDAFAAYEAERIRKLARHTNPTRLGVVETDDDVVAAGVTRADVGTASVLAVGPVRRSATPRLVAKSQLAASPDRFSGTLPHEPARTAGAALHVEVNPALGMSVLKLAAQVGHAAQLAHRLIGLRDPAALDAWRENGWDSAVFRPARLEPGATAYDVVVRDAGFTEIPPGSLTVRAVLRRGAG